MNDTGNKDQLHRLDWGPRQNEQLILSVKNKNKKLFNNDARTCRSYVMLVSARRGAAETISLTQARVIGVATCRSPSR